MLLTGRHSLVMPWYFVSFPSEHVTVPLRPPVVGSIFSEDVVVDWICRWTPRDFRAALQETGHFLYRGASQEDLKHTLQQPAPDLLLPETYGNDPVALAYFECLEERLNSASTGDPSIIITAKPSTGHIATSDPNEAGKWGPVISVWPLGTRWSYVWPKDRETFYNADAPSGVKPTSMCQDDKLMIDTGLVQALQQPREVLFASSGLTGIKASAFLGIPYDQNDKLRQKLQQVNYGLDR